MKATYIDYCDTHSFSDTAMSYLAQSQDLAPFISQFPSPEGFDQLIKQRQQQPDRTLLQRVLKEQYQLGCIGRRDAKQVYANIDKLALDNTYTITTGHQLNIFTGPLYFIYKIVTAINTAKELSAAFPDKNFVPVYWMATEDHDFAEINHLSVHGKPVAWDLDAQGATGRLSTETIKPAIDAYCELLGISPNAREWLKLIEDAYLHHKKLSDATRFLVNSLFKDYGLIVVDADNKALKKSFSPIIKEDILSQKSYELINQTSELLEKRGFATQVHAREINFFYLTDDLRERIVFENNIYHVLNSDIRFTPEELADEIEYYPERFSPNVVMRPLYQEVILPNIAYIGGGAELVYWLQLKANFDHYGVSYPVVMLRNSAMLVNESFSTKLCRLRIPVKDIFKPTHVIQNEWVIKNSEHSLSLIDERNELAAIFEKVKLRAYKIDPTLAPSSEAVNARLQRAISNLEKKFIKADKRNHEGAINQISDIRNKYFAGNSLQERKDNFGLYYQKYGKELIPELIKHFKPLDFKFTILEP